MNIPRSSFARAVRCMCTKPTTNNEIKPFIYNRNPRNLEKLRLARKPKGFPFEEQLVEYWHRYLFSYFYSHIKLKRIY